MDAVSTGLGMKGRVKEIAAVTRRDVRVDLREGAAFLCGDRIEARSQDRACGDMRSLRLGKKFDAVVALFHVLSYQTMDEDVRSALITVEEHLNSRGVAALDFWYGPAVLSQKPEVRFKEVSDASIEVSRIALPVLHDDINVVDVNYRAFIKEKNSGRIDELRECHRMRYFFDAEIKRFIQEAGIAFLTINAWMTEVTPSEESWAAVAVGQLR